MHHRPLALLAVLAALHSVAQQPLTIPPALDQDTFDLFVAEHVHQFYPGINTPTYGVNGDYLGPTLILHQGDSTHIRVHNALQEMTSMHWHGMQVPGEADGGPPRMVMPGDTWSLAFQVKDPASTHWYHPHPHGATAEQANRGIAGMMIVRDDAEAQLALPRTYGVDDLPLVVQDRRFLASGEMVLYPLGDSVLVNGTPRPYAVCPAQVVRLRLLNGSNSRVYRFGLTDDRPFTVIANDGGLLNAPVTTDRLMLSNGERVEVLVDLTGMEGDSLALMSYASELDAPVPGSSYILWESSALNGIDFQVLRIRVGPPTPDAITSIPTHLVHTEAPSLADVSRTRQKSLSGNGMVGMGSFYINGLQFDEDVVNDTVQLGATEIWRILNASDIAHPFHIHGGHFFILDRDGLPPPAYEAGPKDVVLVNMAETVRFIMKFDEPTNGWPFMYHCHNLMHEDGMMMLQYIVVDPSTAVTDAVAAAPVQVYPSPTTGTARYACSLLVDEREVVDHLGRTVLHDRTAPATQGEVDLSALRPGLYALRLSGQGRTLCTTVVRE